MNLTSAIGDGHADHSQPIKTSHSFSRPCDWLVDALVTQAKPIGVKSGTLPGAAPLLAGVVRLEQPNLTVLGALLLSWRNRLVLVTLVDL